MKRTSLAAAALLVSCIIFLSASVVEDDPFSMLMKRIETYAKSNPQEKVHLHLDKPHYAIGDDIWFKAYVLDARSSEPSNFSAILYVELIDEKDSVKQQLKLPLAYGLAWGDFKLPDSLSEGNYRIRAYTQLMRNLGPKFFFDKTIKVGNSWANEVFASVRYKYNRASDGNPHVNAALSFTDKDKQPYPGAEVSYDVRIGGKSVSKGKATTDGSGEMLIGLTQLRDISEKQGWIMVSMTLPDKHHVVKRLPLTALSNEVDVQFFPEGGSLVQDLPSKIGIKATGANGRGRRIEGSILNDEGTEIIRFVTNKKGMTHVSMTPKSGRKYTAKVKFEDGSDKTFNLPQTAESGYVMNVNNSHPDHAVIKIMSSASLLHKGELKLIAQHQGCVYAVSKFKSDKQMVSANIPKKNLPSGIIQLTLFTPDDVPVCERLFFVSHPHDQLGMRLSSAKTTYGLREEVKLNLDARLGGKSSQGSFSVSVTNTTAVVPDEDNESNILTSLLLTSDLAGYVESPNSYFIDDNKETVEALDNLLLTQGWRRFDWKDVLSDTPTALRFMPETSLKISGTIKINKKKVVPNARVTLLSSKGGVAVLDTLADANGRFVFDRLTFSDTAKFILQARYGKDRKFVEIEIDQVPGQVVTRNKNTGDIEINVNESIQRYLTKSESFFDQQVKRGLLKKVIQLDEVKIRAEKPNPAINSTNLNGPGKANYVFGGDVFETVSLPYFLVGHIAGLSYINGKLFSSRYGKRSKVTILVDGMSAEDMFEDLNDIPTDNIESVEYMAGHYAVVYGSRGNGSVLLITTKSGNGRIINLYTPGLINRLFKGFSPIREFYSPKYGAVDSQTGSDLRTTIYWNPNVSTDEDGKGSFSFYTADEPGQYRVVIEGIEKNGKIARQVLTYEVKHPI